MTKKAKPTTEAKQEARQEEKARQEAKPTQQQAKPTKKPKPVVKRITWTYFERFTNSSNRKTSWVKETIERATNEPVMVKNLTRGQIMALINQVDRYNMNTDRKIIYKYDVKRGIVLLAPKDSLIARLKQQEGEQK
jgi:hypothetical protein